MDSESESKRQETKLEVQSFIGNLKYAIESGNAKVNLVEKRNVDKDRDPKYTNGFTLNKLFPKENYVESIKTS